MRTDWLGLCLLALGLCLNGGPIHAAGPPRRAPGKAELRLTFDPRGNLTIYCVVFALPEKPAVLADALTQGLRSGLQDVDWDIDDGRRVVSLYARSSTTFRASALRVRGQLDLNPLDRVLAGLGVPAFEVHLTHPRSAYSHFSPGQECSEPGSPLIEYRFAPALEETLHPPVQFEFGYRTMDALGSAGPLCALALVPAGVWWKRRRLPMPALASVEAGVRKNLSAIYWLLGFWAAWAAIVFALKADILFSFVLGAASPMGRALVVIALILLPLMITILFSMADLRALSPGAGPADALGVDRARLILRSQAALLLPAVLLALGIAAVRENSPARAHAWFISAGLVAVCSAGLFAWATLVGVAPAKATAEPSALSEEFRRQTLVRYWIAQLFAIVLLPAVTVFAVREARLPDIPHYLVLLGGLIASALLLLGIDYWLPFLGLRQAQLRSRAWMSPNQHPLDPSNGWFVVASATGRRALTEPACSGEFAWIYINRAQLLLVSERARFNIARTQVQDISTIPLASGWLSGQQLALRLHAAPDRPALLYLRPAGVRSLGRTRRATTELADRLRLWLSIQGQPEDAPADFPWADILPFSAESLQFRPAPRQFARLALALSIVAMSVWGVCLLLQFPFDLSQGEEGWAMVLLASGAALFALAPYRRSSRSITA